LETLKLTKDLRMKEIIWALWRDSQFRVASRKEHISFESDVPLISDYSIFAAEFGQFPDIKLTTIDALGNRITRSELPYFVMDAGLISSIEFGILVDGVQRGFITISK